MYLVLYNKMKNKIIYFISIQLIITVLLCSACNSNNYNEPRHDSSITFDEDLNPTDWGDSGQKTSDGNYYYYGNVTLTDEYGSSRTFSCYQGTKGLESGCRGIIHNGKFYNLDRNSWITIDGIRYKAYN